MQGRQRRRRGRERIPTTLVVVAATAVGGALAAAVVAGTPRTPVVEVLGVQLDRASEATRPPHFTLAELAAGTVDPERYEAFWATQVAAIDAAPCPTRTPPVSATTAATFAAGATPPPHLADRYSDWAPRLAAAHDRQAARCAPPDRS